MEGETGSATPTESQAQSSATSGLRTSTHGDVFQLKLLMLFLIRGINAKYQFKLGTETPGMGGKFDDLVFKYIKEDATATGDQYSYRFLQAKHKQKETEKIKASQLLHSDSDGDFSLAKYFVSYRHDLVDILGNNKKILPEEVDYCFICTNIGFEDDKELKEKGIELDRVDINDNFLNLENVLPTFYKLKKTDILRQEMLKWSEIHLLAKMLLKYATDKKSLTLNKDKFKRYHDSLICPPSPIIQKGENETKLHPDFIQNNNLTEDAERFREILSELTFVQFWRKISFCNVSNKEKNKQETQGNLQEFNCASLELPVYTPKMEMDFSVFDKYRNELKQGKALIIKPDGKLNYKKPFSNVFIEGLIDLSFEVRQFRKVLSNYVFVHYWKDLALQLSSDFSKASPSGTTNIQTLNNSVDERDIDGFLDKLVFAVKMPNEVKLGKILNREIGRYYKLLEADLQASYFLKNMLDWFKEKESRFLTAEEGEQILNEAENKIDLAYVDGVSEDYQDQLNGALELNENAITNMLEKLKSFLNDRTLKIERITTSCKTSSAVKVIGALKKFQNEMDELIYEPRDSYLVTQSSRIHQQFEKFTNILSSPNSHHLIVIVCDHENDTESRNNQYYTGLVAQDQTGKKKVIVIGNESDNKGHESRVKDKIVYADLKEDTKEKLRSKTIPFQGGKETAFGALIGDGNLESKVFDYENTMEELLFLNKATIVIPSFTSFFFDLSHSIKRFVTLRQRQCANQQFWDKVDEELVKRFQQKPSSYIVVDPQGKIKWETEDGDDKLLIWKTMNSILSAGDPIQHEDESTDHSGAAVEDLIKENGVFIISGVAGSGKSATLSHLYKKIKEREPGVWIIRIQLADHQIALKELNSEDDSTVFEYFVNFPSVVGQSSFARALLKHRLDTGNRIVFMLDGFDEIDSQCQENAIKLMEAIAKKPVPLYVTTRSHTANTLEFKLSQLACTLIDFNKKDQINCLTSFWKEELNDYIENEKMKNIIQSDVNILNKEDENELQKFAESVVNRVTAELTKDSKDKSLIGNPLQCRILAECFLQQLKEALDRSFNTENEQAPSQRLTLHNVLFAQYQKFDLVSLYEMLMETKRQVFYKGKVGGETPNHIVNASIDETIKQIELHLTKFAVETIFPDQEHVKTMWPLQSLYQSELEGREQVKKLDELGISFGLVDRINNGNSEKKETNNRNLKFLHRTFAEYLVAKYLYQGFHLETDQHNKLLDNEPVRQLIVNEVLINDEYDGVRLFLDAMFNETVHSVLKDTTIGTNFHELLPHRLQLFSDYLISRVEKHSMEPNPLTVSAKGGNNAIFQFICHVLDTKIDKLKKIQFIILQIFHHVDDNRFFEQRGPIYERILEYFDGTDDEKQTDLIRKFVDFYQTDHRCRISTKQLSLTINFLSKICNIKSSTKISKLECIQLNLHQNWKRKWLNLLGLLAKRAIEVAFIQGMFSDTFPIEKLPNIYKIIYDSDPAESSNQERVGFAAIIIRRHLFSRRISPPQQVGASKLFAGIELVKNRSPILSNFFSIYGCETTKDTIHRVTADLSVKYQKNNFPKTILCISAINKDVKFECACKGLTSIVFKDFQMFHTDKDLKHDESDLCTRCSIDY